MPLSAHCNSHRGGSSELTPRTFDEADRRQIDRELPRPVGAPVSRTAWSSKRLTSTRDDYYMYFTHLNPYAPLSVVIKPIQKWNVHIPDNCMKHVILNSNGLPIKLCPHSKWTQTLFLNFLLYYIINFHISFTFKSFHIARFLLNNTVWKGYYVKVKN